ncbi:hypothetical protein ACG3SL_17560 [Sphingomonas sp. CJ20]
MSNRPEHVIRRKAMRTRTCPGRSIPFDRIADSSLAKASRRPRDICSRKTGLAERAIPSLPMFPPLAV